MGDALIPLRARAFVRSPGRTRTRRWALARLGGVRPGSYHFRRLVDRSVQLLRNRVGRRRAAPTWRAVLPATLEDLARSLRSGASVPTAIAEVAGSAADPVGASFARLHARLVAGDDLASALRSWTASVPHAPLALPAAALLLASERGGSRAWAVDQVAATLRERLAVEGELRSLAAQARLSALVVGCSPIAFGALVLCVDPQVLGFFPTPLGLACLSGGLVLDASGAWWMTRLVRRAR